jgi:hypothetical protein
MRTTKENHQRTFRKTAIIVGVLYIIGTVAGILSVVFMGSVLKDPDYLINISTNANQMMGGALSILVMGLALAMVPVVMYPVARKFNEILALGYVVFRGALETVTYIATVITFLLLLALSKTYVQAGAPDDLSFKVLGTVLLKAENISQVTTIVFILGALMFYYLLFQSRLVPRWISGWGLIATIPYFASGFLVIFGLTEHMSTIDTVLRLPLGLQEMALAVWLIIKGFNPSALDVQSA